MPNRLIATILRLLHPSSQSGAGGSFCYFCLAEFCLERWAIGTLRTQGTKPTDDATIERHVIQVSPKVSALVKAVHFDDNYQVRRGDLLVELDPRDFEVNRAIAAASLASAHSKVVEAQAQQNAALAGLGQSKADLAGAEATAENAEADFHRNEDLYKTKVIDRREYDASDAQAKSSAAAVESSVKKIASQEAQIQLASAQYNTALAAQNQSEAQLRQADLQLSYTKILAPFDGRITKKSIEPGNYVQPGQTLFSLVPDEVWVIANFKETQLKQMKVGQPVSIKVDALPGREFRAHVESFQVGTGSVFTLLPPENATGNYVKVAQRVPVKIVFDEAAANLDRLWAGEIGGTTHQHAVYSIGRGISCDPVAACASWPTGSIVGLLTGSLLTHQGLSRGTG